MLQGAFNMLSMKKNFINENLQKGKLMNVLAYIKKLDVDDVKALIDFQKNNTESGELAKKSSRR